jgi:adenosylcobinamide-GDP ribazoletransferase
MSFLDDVRICLIFFTRLPGSWQGDLPRARITQAFGAAPVVGLVIGLIGWLAYLLASLWGMDPIPAAIVAVGAQVIATGAFHEDGFTDAFDGFGGGKTREEKLAILRDSRIGTFGAAALFLALMLKVALIAEIGAFGSVFAALIAGGVLGRAALVTVMRGLPPAADDGMSAEAGQPSAGAMMLAIGLAIGLTVVAFLVGDLGATIPGVVFAIVGATLAALAVALIAARQIGGQTGDVLGAVAVAAELGVLAALAAG